MLRTGLVIVPNHYYVECPDVNLLAATCDEWAKPSRMVGIDSTVDDEIDWLRKSCQAFIGETTGNRVYLEATAGRLGPGFGYIEAQVLHCFLRFTQPRRIVEVGSGVSTACALHAIALNQHRCEITCIEPSPKEWLLREKLITLKKQTVQTIPLEFFAGLKSGDFLFIDSSHAVKTGSDVNFLILEVLPRLKAGVFVHFHDITFPYCYNPDSLRSFIHPQEAALLQAYLIGNRQLHVLFSLSRLHHERSHEMREILPEYRPMPMTTGLSDSSATGHFPSSIYLQVAAQFALSSARL